MKSGSIALLIYGDSNSGRDALSEDKYRDLASTFSAKGFEVSSVLYNDGLAGELAISLVKFDAVLVWVNPIEQDQGRAKLDALLLEIANKGCYVSTHPDTILKIGTKDILYKTRDMGWGSDTKMYTSFEDFRTGFYPSLQAYGVRVLKQYRGNGGNGVFKISLDPDGNNVMITHATNSDEVKTYSLDGFYTEFKPFFSNKGLLIDQEWNTNIANGMVRCYLTGTKVSGFGYQEINALYELNTGSSKLHLPPGKRYYFTENCGLFSDLKEAMENVWVPELQNRLSIPNDKLPIIWDADFFINGISGESAVGKYNLCEINVSCVSPFPPSAIEFMVDEVGKRIRK